MASEISGPISEIPTDRPVSIDGYKTILFTMPPASMFPEGVKPTGVFMGYDPNIIGVGRYVIWLIHDSYFPGMTNEERWVGEEAEYAGNIIAAAELHEAYMRHIISRFRRM